MFKTFYEIVKAIKSLVDMQSCSSEWFCLADEIVRVFTSVKHTFFVYLFIQRLKKHPKNIFKSIVRDIQYQNICASKSAKRSFQFELFICLLFIKLCIIGSVHLSSSSYHHHRLHHHPKITFGDNNPMVYHQKFSSWLWIIQSCIY